MPVIPTLPLNDGRAIPVLGLGTYPLKNLAVADAVVAAAELGYRHIDTAEKYGNEKGVGDGVRRTGIPREEFFVTTKLDGKFQGDDKALAGLEQSLKRMRMDYVDLLLIHWPLPKRGKFASTFRTFQKLKDAGLARSIGVSNFTAGHLQTLIDGTGLTPAVNQLQIDPTIPRVAQRAYDDEHGIVTTSWSPLGGSGNLLQNATIAAVASRAGASPAQVVLAWHLAQGLVAIPKSGSPERMAQNLAALDVQLTDADLADLETLSLGEGAGVDSDKQGH